MPWDNSLVTDPPDYKEQSRGALCGTYDVGDRFWANNDTALWKFSNFSDNLEITLSLYNDEQCNTQPFEEIVFSMPADSPPNYWRFTGFPPRGNGNPKDDFRFAITTRKLTNRSRACGNYAMSAPK